MNYKKAKEKWVKERLSTAILVVQVRGACGDIICEWFGSTWYYPLVDCPDLSVSSTVNYFWNLGDNIYDKFYQIRKIARTNKNVNFKYRSIKMVEKEGNKHLKRIGLI